MSYDARHKVREEVDASLDKIMSYFPKDYSDATIKMIRQEIASKINGLMSEYKDAFCEDHDLCPMCVTGGWNCGSDHK